MVLKWEGLTLEQRLRLREDAKTMLETYAWQQIENALEQNINYVLREWIAGRMSSHIARGYLVAAQNIFDTIECLLLEEET